MHFISTSLTHPSYFAYLFCVIARLFLLLILCSNLVLKIGNQRGFTEGAAYKDVNKIKENQQEMVIKPQFSSNRKHLPPLGRVNYENLANSWLVGGDCHGQQERSQGINAQFCFSPKSDTPRPSNGQTQLEDTQAVKPRAQDKVENTCKQGKENNPTHVCFNKIAPLYLNQIYYS